MDIATIIIFIILLLLSAFFSGTEIALMSLPRHKIKSFIKQGLFGAKDLEYIKKNPDRLLITILIGNNLVNTYTAALATSIAINILQNKNFGIEQAKIIGITTGIVTLLLLLFGEIAPKSFAIKNAEKISLLVAKIYRVLMFLFYPIIIIVELITKIFIKNRNQNTLSEEELEAFIDMGKESGTLEEDEHKKIKNLLDFGDTTVEEIMTPRVKMDKLPDTTNVKNALKYILSHTHSRIPVYHGDVDHIIGIVNVRILLSEINNNNESKLLKDLKLIKPIKIPLTKHIDDLLKTFQQEKKHLAIVIDEYGGVAGIVTLEDIIEEIFGEIQDETDKEEEAIKKIEENKYEVQPTILVNDLLEIFNLNFSDLKLKNPYEYDGETLSYLITDILERFPYTDETIKISLNNGYLNLKVLKVNDGIIGKIIVSLNK